MVIPLSVLAEAPLVIPAWAWVAFLGFVVSMLALDLGVFNKTDHKPSFKEAVAWCVVWVALAVAFGFLLSAWRGPEDAQLFAAGYVLELALSAFLLFTGVKLALSRDEHEGKGMDENLFVRIARKFFPLTPHLHGNKFWVKEDGVRRFTPLFLVLIVVEGTDLIFAIDSIPAVLGILPPNLPIEEKRFVAFTSNIFAIMGLRSMYFALAGFMQYFRFLKPALAFVLVFIGLKMILPWAASLGQPAGQFASWMPVRFVDHGRVHFPTELSLSVIGLTLALAIAFSVAFPKKK